MALNSGGGLGSSAASLEKPDATGLGRPPLGARLSPGPVDEYQAG
jgi:hypothetical protein